MTVGELFGAACVVVAALVVFGGGNPGTDPLPTATATVPSSAAMTVPPTNPPNPGYGLHCTYGPNDNDVRGVVKAATPTLPNC